MSIKYPNFIAHFPITRSTAAWRSGFRGVVEVQVQAFSASDFQLYGVRLGFILTTISFVFNGTASGNSARP
jgi:hypothetical protein